MSGMNLPSYKALAGDKKGVECYRDKKKDETDRWTNVGCTRQVTGHVSTHCALCIMN